MKSYNNLWEQVRSLDNIKKAILKASEDKRSRKDVILLLKDIESHAKKIQNCLDENRFYIRPHHPTLINDGSQHKIRLIVQPQLSYELVVQHCLMNVVSPLIMKRMYRYNCGSVPKRGNYYGKAYLESKIQEFRSLYPDKALYCLKLDITKFFPSVSHKILKCKLSRLIRDKRVLALLFYFIDAYSVEYFPDTDTYKVYYFDTSIDTGLPVGYITSQWLANFYLETLDTFIKQELHIDIFARFMDDMVILHSDSNYLHTCLIKIKNYVESELRLRLKQNYQVFQVKPNDKSKIGRPINFMGFRFYMDYTFVNKHILYTGTRKLKKINYKEQHNLKVTWYDATQYMSYNGWYEHTQTHKIILDYKEKYNFSKDNLTSLISKHSKITQNKN